MRKIARKALTTTAVAASAVALTAVPASAAVTSVTINPTGTDIPITAVNNGNIIGADDRTGVAAICTGLVAKGNIPSSGPVGPNDVAFVTSVTFSGCTVLGNPATLTAQGLPWSLDVTDVTSGGVTPGQLQGVNVHISVPALGCESDAKGPGATPGFIEGKHHDRPALGSPSQLTLPPPGSGLNDNIVLENVNEGCPEDIARDGDSVTIAGTLDIMADVPPTGPTNDTGLTVSAT